MEGMSGGVSDFMQVLQKAAEPGSMVKKGDIVAEFDRQYQETRLDDFRASVEQGETNMRKIDSELEVTRKSRELSIEQARASVEKAKLDTRTTPVLSQIQAEQLKLQLEEAEARLKQLLAEVPFQQISERAQRRNTEISLEQSRKELQMAQRNVERLSLTAPMDGMVVMQQTFRSGEFSQIKEGDQLMSGQMFMQIVDPSSMMVAASVNQADVEMIRVGAPARLHFDAYPGLELPGRVVSIGAMTKTGGQRADFVKEIPVFIKVERIDPQIIPDLSVSADVLIQEEREQILVPIESIQRDDSSGQPYVFVRTAAGYERRSVELGLTSNVKAAVKSGLKEGETVFTERPPEKPGKQKSPVARAPRMIPQGVDYVEGC
jgi:HlyD family secretion protein